MERFFWHANLLRLFHDFISVEIWIGERFGRELFIDGFQIWLVLHDRDMCTVQAAGPWLDWPRLLPMAQIPGQFKGAGGLFDGRGIALLAFDRGAGSSLSIASYGDVADSLVQRLAGHLAAWQTAGRPGRERLRLRYFPSRAPSSGGQGPRVVRAQGRGELEATWQ